MCCDPERERGEIVSLKKFLQDTWPGGMIWISVGITSYVDRDPRVRTLDVFYDHGVNSNGYDLLLLKASCGQVYSYVSCGTETRDIKDERKNR